MARMHVFVRSLQFKAPVVALFCALSGCITHAQISPEAHAQVQLLAEESVYQPGRQFWVGVFFRLDSGWHIYWQNPGDSGTPPKIQWTLPQGFHAGTLRWPRPIRLGKETVIDYGYEGQVLLMAPIMAAADATGTATIGANVKYVVCRDICIPGKSQLSLAIPHSSDRIEHHSESRPLFQSTRQQFPGLPSRAWRVSARSDKNSFELTVGGATPKHGTAFFPFDPDVIDNAAPAVLTPLEGGFALKLEKSELLTKPVLLLRGVLDVPGTGAFDIAVPVAQEGRPAVERRSP